MIGWLVVAGAMLAGLPAGLGQADTVVAVPAASTPMLKRPTVRRPAPDRWIGEDKARHFALSFAATSMAYGGARLGMDPGPGRRAAATAALLLGVGKELLDARGGGPFSSKDLAWDAAGVALGFLLAQKIR